MGSAASSQPPFETEEAALAAGKTQEEIDAWKKENAPAPAPHTTMGDADLLYWATGSMVNPTSVRLRGLKVADSAPGELLDHELVFFGPNGYLAPLAAKGKTMYGIVHRISKETLAVIDALMKGWVMSKKISVWDDPYDPYDPYAPYWYDPYAP